LQLQVQLQLQHLNPALSSQQDPPQ
jgi:hypothetical protein